MPINVKVRKSKSVEIRSVSCPVCFVGEMKYVINGNKKTYDFECSTCRALGNADWFDIMTNSKIGKENRLGYHVKELKLLPM